MGTKFRTLLAPIGLSTGDGRRFADGGITLADLPMPFEWARVREGGHDGAVGIGATQEAAILSVKDAVAGDWISAESVKGMAQDTMGVWAKGELFDDVDREALPRLAEDVAEAMHLMSAGTLGPSVDLDSFEAVPVFEGTDDPVTWEAIEAYYEEHGEEPKLELLITEGRVRAATLVSIPAFSETCRPLELIEDDSLTADEGRDGEARAQLLALVASMQTAPEHRPPVEAFVRPTLDGPTPITWDWDTGRVFGHIATWRTCHTGYADVCVTPPQAESGYGWFNRYGVDTADGGMIAAGRLTLGGPHAALSFSASSAMQHHDGLTVAADVVAYEDEHGIVVAGAIRPGLSGSEMAILERRKVSGDWREIGGQLALIEVLALSPGPRATSEPGFPVQTHSRGGRQVALTASFGPEDVPGAARTLSVGAIDIQGAVRAALAEDRRAQAVRQELAAALAVQTNREREALSAVLGEG
jgi:hypothetical protein